MSLDAETVNMVSEPSTGPESPEHIPSEQNMTYKQILKLDATKQLSDARRHIIIPVDDTEDSKAAIVWAVDDIYREGDVFHLLHVVPNPSFVHVWAGIYIPPDEDAELVEIEDTKDFVKHRFATYLIDHHVPFMLHVIVGNDDSESIAKVIAKKAGEIDAALVVMSRHSKGALKSWWLGSVTKTVTKKMMQCPLAVVPPHASVPHEHGE